MPDQTNASKKKSQQLKRNRKRKIYEEDELSENEVRNIVRKQQPEHLSSEGKTKDTNLKQIRIAPNKRKTWKPLSKTNREQLQTMMESIIITILSHTMEENEKIQYHLNFLKKRLLQLCETLKVPPRNLKNITDVSSLLKMEKEQHRANEEGLALLQEEVDKMVETTESVTRNIQSLQHKIQIITTELEEEEEKAKEILHIDHHGILCLPELPQESLKAPILQEEILALVPNKNALLKDLETLHKSTQMKNMLTFIEETYNKLDAS
ncbi:PREDICTED: centromere protein Q [Chrysochloris asiatica]|uniref:Centromere protein Q n=1 Tax=Chrysochloris asiatica TaxID=185453 RepID=A0A9B0THN5_CHRAS|nr:PREDICTED: centromere protein Q [Chrysochloris asiatica]